MKGCFFPKTLLTVVTKETESIGLGSIVFQGKMVAGRAKRNTGRTWSRSRGRRLFSGTDLSQSKRVRIRVSFVIRGNIGNPRSTPDQQLSNFESFSFMVLGVSRQRQTDRNCWLPLPSPFPVPLRSLEMAKSGDWKSFPHSCSVLWLAPCAEQGNRIAVASEVLWFPVTRPISNLEWSREKLRDSTLNSRWISISRDDISLVLRPTDAFLGSPIDTCCFSPFIFSPCFSCTATTLGGCIAFTFHAKTNELIFTRDCVPTARTYTYTYSMYLLWAAKTLENMTDRYYFHDFIHIYIHRMLFLWLFCTRKYLVRTEYVIPLLRIFMDNGAAI